MNSINTKKDQNITETVIDYQEKERRRNTRENQRCKNVRTYEQCSCKMFPSSGKNLNRILRRFDAKVSYFALFEGTFWHILELYVPFFCCSIWVFWYFNAVLSQIRFAVIYALFYVK